MKKTFGFTDDKSNKFWCVETSGNELTVRFGKTGTEGQSQTKSFADPATCENEAEKLIREKTKKGYVEQAEASTEEKICSLPFLESTLKKLHKGLTGEAMEEMSEEPGEYEGLFPEIYEQWVMERIREPQTGDACNLLPIDRGGYEDKLAVEAVKHPENFFPADRRMSESEAQLYFDTVLKGIADTELYWRFSKTDDPERYEITALKRLFEPFVKAFDLDDMQYVSFALAFNDSMASGVKPALTDLLKL